MRKEDIQGRGVDLLRGRRYREGEAVERLTLPVRADVAQKAQPIPRFKGLFGS